MSRPKIDHVPSFAVFGPDGKLCTARRLESDAREAASIIGGTNWQALGYTCEPVTIIRQREETKE